MRPTVVRQGVWSIVAFLSVACLIAAPAGDLRLVDAAKHGDSGAVRSLLKQHAGVNTPEPDGATSLSWAAHWDNLEMADLLIRAGAKVDAANDYGVTPLMLACINGSAAMVDRLLKAGAVATNAAFMRCTQTGNVEAVKSLLVRGANVNANESRRGQTALMWAAAAKHPEVVRVLIDHGADVHSRSKDGFTPLMFAAQ